MDGTPSGDLGMVTKGVDLPTPAASSGVEEIRETITFRSTRVDPGRSCTWNGTGDPTVHDVTRAVTLEVDFDGASISPLGDERMGFSAATEINWED
jgi:hypothetical protein